VAWGDNTRGGAGLRAGGRRQIPDDLCRYLGILLLFKSVVILCCDADSCGGYVDDDNLITYNTILHLLTRITLPCWPLLGYAANRKARLPFLANVPFCYQPLNRF